MAVTGQSLFRSVSLVRIVMPVRLPPGRARLATRPSATGLVPTLKTIGIVEVVLFAAGFHPTRLFTPSALSAGFAPDSGRPADPDWSARVDPFPPLGKRVIRLRAGFCV